MPACLSTAYPHCPTYPQAAVQTTNMGVQAKVSKGRSRTSSVSIALWSRPQARNPCSIIKRAINPQPCNHRTKEEAFTAFPAKAPAPAASGSPRPARASGHPPDSAPSAPPPCSPESARNASSPSSAGQHTPPPGSDAPANPSKQGRSPSLPPEPSFSASPCFRSYEIQAQSGCLRRVCACNYTISNENVTRCAANFSFWLTGVECSVAALR